MFIQYQVKETASTMRYQDMLYERHFPFKPRSYYNFKMLINPDLIKYAVSSMMHEARTTSSANVVDAGPFTCNTVLMRARFLNSPIPQS